MTPRDLAQRMLAKASQDEALLDRVLEDAEISDDVIGFHCQQAAEKMLKAVLAARAVEYRRTHNVRALADLLADAGHPLPQDLQSLDTLTPYAVEARYDFLPASTSALNRKEARVLLRRLRVWAEEQIVQR